MLRSSQSKAFLDSHQNDLLPGLLFRLYEELVGGSTDGVVGMTRLQALHLFEMMHMQSARICADVIGRKSPESLLLLDLKSDINAISSEVRAELEKLETLFEAIKPSPPVSLVRDAGAGLSHHALIGETPDLYSALDAALQHAA